MSCMSFMQEKEEPEYAFELKKQEDEYDKKRAKLQILFGKHQRPIQVLRIAFFLGIFPHPPPLNANKVEPYTFVMLFSGKADTCPTPTALLNT